MKSEATRGLCAAKLRCGFAVRANSTVCALSSDVLCSDAPAAAIAEDGKSIWELVREFEQYLPPDQPYKAPEESPEAIA